MTTRDKLIEALKFDERIWRAFQVLKPVHRDGLLDALEQALAPASTQERSRHTVRVDSGKYTFIVADGPTILIDRHGERWHAQQEAFNALHSIMSELDAARVVLEAARELAKRNAAPPELYAALMKHAALVSDQEKPSDWAGTPDEAPDATLLDDIHQRVGAWFAIAKKRAITEGESASITFELHGDSRGYTPKDEPIYEVTVEEKFFGDHLGGVIKP